MYLNHFRLAARPFEMAPDAAFYYGPPHQVPLNELAYSIEEAQGLALLLGEHGVGKSTVLRRLKSSLSDSHVGVLVSDHGLGGDSLIDQIQRMLGLGFPKPGSSFFAEYLRARALRGEKLVLLIDEAQALTTRQLEEIRFLTDLEQNERRVVEVVLSGPPALAERLAEPPLAALHQRVAVQALVSPLSLAQTKEYVRHRLRVAGSERALFSDEALAAVHAATGGVPRLINLLCERSLLAAFARGAPAVDAATVSIAREELPRPAEPKAPAEEGAEAAADRDIEELFSRLERIEATQRRILELLERVLLVESPGPLARSDEP